MSLRDTSGNEWAQLIEAEAADAPASKQTREERAFMRSISTDSARYGIDIRGFRLHREAQDLDAVFATLEGIQGRISVFDRHTNRVIHGSADDIMRRIAGMVPPDGKD